MTWTGSPVLPLYSVGHKREIVPLTQNQHFLMSGTNTFLYQAPTPSYGATRLIPYIPYWPLPHPILIQVEFLPSTPSSCERGRVSLGAVPFSPKVSR